MERFDREDNGRTGRFLLLHEGVFAGEIVYRWVNDEIFDIVHTEVDHAFSGKGYGKKLVFHAAEFARDNNHKVVIYCPYAKAIFDRNREIQDVLYSEN